MWLFDLIVLTLLGLLVGLLWVIWQVYCGKLQAQEAWFAAWRNVYRHCSLIQPLCHEREPDALQSKQSGTICAFTCALRAVCCIWQHSIYARFASTVDAVVACSGLWCLGLHFFLGPMLSYQGMADNTVYRPLTLSPAQLLCAIFVELKLNSTIFCWLILLAVVWASVAPIAAIAASDVFVLFGFRPLCGCSFSVCFPFLRGSIRISDRGKCISAQRRWDVFVVSAACTSTVHKITQFLFVSILFSLSGPSLWAESATPEEKKGMADNRWSCRSLQLPEFRSPASKILSWPFWSLEVRVPRSCKQLQTCGKQIWNDVQWFLVGWSHFGG